ncbi:MAG: MFS transporter [Pseudomonas sp.]
MAASTIAPKQAGRILTGNVLWLSIVSLLTDFSSEMIYPLLPFFLTTVLGASPAFLGLVEGVAESTASLLKLASGWFSDRVGKRKSLVLAGYGLASIARPLIALVNAPAQLLAIRFADRVGKGIRTAPRDALIADSVDPKKHGTAFGYHRAADHLGAVLGPLAATALLFLLPGRYRVVFALAALPALLSVLVLAWKVREVSAPAATAGKATFRGFRGLGRRFYLFLVIILIFTLGNATDAFLLVRAQQLGVPLALLPLLWGALHVSKMFWNVVGGRLADRLGARPAIITGWLIYAGTYAGFAVASAALHAWLLFLAYGLFFGLTEAPEKALVAASAPVGQRGAAFGAYHFSIGLAALPASLLFGVIWQQYSASAAFLMGAALALCAALALLTLGRSAHTDAAL